MQLSPEKEVRVRSYVKGKLKNADIAHAFDHIAYVVNLVKKIGKAEGANLGILIPAAYFHDVAFRGKKFVNHTERSAYEAEKFFRRLGFTETEINKIREVIISSSYKAYEKGIKPKSLEAKVLRDADWLEAMGARGIGRAFVFGTHYGSKKMGEVNWDPENPVKLKVSFKGADPSPIHHFFSKLLWLRDYMQTKTGRKMAEGRHKLMVKFLKQYKSECEGKA